MRRSSAGSLQASMARAPDSIVNCRERERLSKEHRHRYETKLYGDRSAVRGRESAPFSVLPHPCPAPAASFTLPPLAPTATGIAARADRPVPRRSGWRQHRALPALADHFRIRASRTFAALLPLLLIGTGAAKAAEVTAESIIDQASALRDASSRVPAGAQLHPPIPRLPPLMRGI